MSTTPSLKPRTPDRAFFSDYWRTGRPRWNIYRYQWFLEPCRDFVFGGLSRAPRGVVLELGRGGGSTAPGEERRSHVALDIVSCPSRGLRHVIGDAQRLPFLSESLSGIWAQTVLMHVDPVVTAEEALRALKPEGVFGVVEPLRGHPGVAAARRLLPARRTAARFLSLAELRALGSGFAQGEVRAFFLLSPLLLPIGRMSRLVRLSQALDDVILERLPSAQGWAWYAAAWFQK